MGYLMTILCTLVSSIVSYSQQNKVEKKVFQNLTINDGLSQGMVNQIIQDRYGFMWFATKDGLNQYDGYHFKIYRHDAEEAHSLSDSFVQSLFEDSKGRIWAGTLSGNLDFFDHESGKFYPIIPEVNKTDNLSGPVNQIVEDIKGNIWVLYYNKLYQIKTFPKTGKLQSLGYSIKEFNIPRASNFLSLFISKEGSIYLYENGSPIFYEFLQPSYQWSKHTLVDKKLTNKKDQSNFRIFKILQHKVTRKMYVVCNTGIFLFDGYSAVEQLLSHEMNPLTQCFWDNESNIWFIENYEFGIFNIKSRKLSFLTASDEMSKTKIGLYHSSYIDRSGMLWIGTKGYGLLTFNFLAQKFHHTGNTSVFTITETPEVGVYVNDGNSLYKLLDLETGTYKDTVAVPQATIYFENFNEFSFPSYLDKKHGRWFADEKRLVCYNTLTKQSISYPLPFKQTNGSYVSDIEEDENGKIWVGTAEGLLCFDVLGNKWKMYKNDPKNSSSLSFNAIFSLCFDPTEPAKYLWIGTNGGGFNRMDITTGKCIRYTIKNGLPNDVIYGILKSDDNNLWMSTNKGLSCFNPLKQTFKNYEEKDGLQSNEFNHNAYLRSKNGTLFFGGVNGYNYFNPKDIVSNPTAPQIVITDLRIRNKSLQLNQEKSSLKSSVYLTKKIQLPYEDNMITFEFASLDFIAPEKNQYKYKMEGFDKEWVNAGNTHVATYTNLDPGTYTFNVKGSNSDEVWNEEGTSIELTIIPPWYMTWWFRSLMALAIIFTIYFIYQYRLAQAFKLHKMRNSIANDLHDEIGSNLSNISIFSEVAQQQKGTATETEPLLQKISEYTQVSMVAMSDIVWMINARNDAFENIISRMRALAAEVFEAKKFNFHLHFDEQLNQLTLDMEQRKNFYLLYKEAINNVAKYADCQNVWVTLKKENKTIILIVQDDGIGFDKAKQNQGNGLFTMQKRAEVLKGQLTIDSVIKKGTIIKLVFNS